ncbi:MAG: hypothetical protein PHR77_03680 [Kiritimatiellae bacterium]|nr:hypothetical protein [Kiritimatiellia bacterium]MDD5522684.1 hypothetical protein [Kiritimatiellia bacterium]
MKVTEAVSWLLNWLGLRLIRGRIYRWNYFEVESKRIFSTIDRTPAGGQPGAVSLVEVILGLARFPSASPSPNLYSTRRSSSMWYAVK